MSALPPVDLSDIGVGHDLTGNIDYRTIKRRCIDDESTLRGIGLSGVLRNESSRMLSFFNENFYHQLSRRELRDLICATESSATSPNAVLITVIEQPGSGIFKKTFVAPTSGDLAEFCEDVIRNIRKMVTLPAEPSDEGETAEKAGSLPRSIHLIHSDHPHCLWKLSLDIIERSLRSSGTLVVQHQFSAVWQKRIEVLHS